MEVKDMAEQNDRMASALRKLSLPIPGSKGMGPIDRAALLHAELERRIATAKDALRVPLLQDGSAP